MFRNKVVHLLVTLAVLIVASGCGGGGSGGGGTSSAGGGASSADSVALKVASVECLNGSNLEAGRTVQLKSIVNSMENSDQNVTILYSILKTSDNNATDSFFATDTFVPLQGDNSRDINATLPVSLQSGSYRVVAIADNEMLGSEDFNISTLDEALYAKTDALYIQANDGKPDIETTSLMIAATDSANMTERAVSKTPTVLTLDFGAVSGNVILNSRAVAFTGALKVQDFIAKTEAFKVSACIDLEGSCKSIELYSVDDSNQTHYDAFQTVSSMEPNHPKDVIFTGVIRKNLLNDIAAKVIKNSNFMTTIKVSVGGIDESSTQDPEKNSITAAVKFAPIFLSSSNIDNTNDRVALALSNYKLSMKTYIDDIKKIDPAYNVEVKSGGLDLFNPDLNWQINDPLEDITLQEQNVNMYTDEPIVFKPVIGPTNIQMVEPDQIPIPIGVNEQNDPINNIEPVDDYISQLSVGTAISPALQGTIDNSDLAKAKTVGHKLFKADYDIPLYEGNNFALKGHIYGQALFDFTGVHFQGDADGRVFVVHHWFDIIGIEARSQTTPANLEQTGYRFEIDSLGVNLYEQHKYVTEYPGVSTSHAKTMKQRVQENVATLKNMNGDLIAYNNDLNFPVDPGDNGVFMVGPIPVSYSYRATGKIGVKLALNIKSIGRIDVGVTPYTSLDAEGHVAVGLVYNFHGHDVGVGTGIKGALHIIDERFTMAGSAGIKFIAGDDGIESYIGELNEAIVNEFTPPWGCLSFFGACCFWEYTHHIWCSDQHTDKSILLMKHQTLFKVNLL